MVAPARVVEDRLVDRRCPREHGDPVGGDAGERPVHVEDRLGEHGGPGGDAGEDAGLQPEHVEVRVHHEVAVVGVEPGHGHPVGGHERRAGMRLHHTLRRTGRAGREHDVGDVVRGDSGLAALHLGSGVRRDGVVEVGPRHRFGRHRAVDHDDRLEIGELGVGLAQQVQVVGAQEVGDRDQHLGGAPLEDRRRFSALEARVDRHEHRTGLEQAEQRDDPPRAVGCPDRDAVAGSHAQRHQPRAEGARLPPGARRR